MIIMKQQNVKYDSKFYDLSINYSNSKLFREEKGSSFYSMSFL